MQTVNKQRKVAGRPAKSVKKETRITIRFSRAEHFIIREKAKMGGVKPSVYLRQVGIHGGVIPRLTDEERQFVKQLIGMANNLNQLAKACHQQGVLQAMVYFESYRNNLDDLLQKLKP